MKRPCPDSMYGEHGPEDVVGRCPWCRKRLSRHIPPQPEPEPAYELLSYEEFYDPDWVGR